MAINKVPNSVCDMRRDARNIVLRPLITEKSMDQNVFNRYTFLVDLKANKIEIRNAIQSLFNVTVTKVSTVRVMGKMKRRGRVMGKRPDFKKAYVTLKKGDTIEVAGAPLFEK